jgi:hypothetical protein
MISIQNINDSIYNIDLSELSKNLHNENMVKDFLEPPGTNHYQLLSCFSLFFDDSILLDIGTNEGASALAMSYNKSNKIYSFDLVDNRKINENLNNIHYIIDDITREYTGNDGKYDNLVLSSSMIMLDTEHDGRFEFKFYKYLKKINYKGYLFLDDIYLNKIMVNFWNYITEEKMDLTNLGHWSGSGLVVFK